jgi:uncharacterized protein involved in exopolysaccharide biosynthesis
MSNNHDLQIEHNGESVAVTITTIEGEGQLAENINETLQEAYKDE